LVGTRGHLHFREANVEFLPWEHKVKKEKSPVNRARAPAREGAAQKHKIEKNSIQGGSFSDKEEKKGPRFLTQSRKRGQNQMRGPTSGGNGQRGGKKEDLSWCDSGGVLQTFIS